MCAEVSRMGGEYAGGQTSKKDPGSSGRAGGWGVVCEY